MALKDTEDSRYIIKKGTKEVVDRYEKQIAAARANRIDKNKDKDNEVAVARGARPASTDRMQEFPMSFKDIMLDGIEKDFNLSYTSQKMRAEKQAADAKANREEAEEEGSRLAKGGRVTGFKGYGAAKKV
jgi:hypothetical protein